MNSIVNFLMRFTGKNYTALQRAVSMVPGILIFLVISPFFIFLLSRYMGSFIPLHVPRILELAVMVGALLISNQ